MAGVTWYAGLRLGLVATAVAAALSWIVVVRSGAIPETVEAGSLHLAIAILVAAVVCFLTDGLHRSLRTSASLLQRQRELLDEVIAREEGTRVLADGVSKLVAYVDARGRYRFTNRTFEDWFGVPGKDLEGRDEAEFLGEPAYEQVKPFVNAALAGQRVSFDAVIPYRLGGTRSVHSDYVPDIAASGKVRGYFAITADETERRQYEEQLAESEARSRGILNASLDGLIITNEDGIILSLNPAAERLFGYAQNELVGQQVNVLVPPSARKAHDPRHWANTSSGHSDILGKGRDLTGVTKGGQVFPAHVAVGEIVTGSGRLFTCTIHDLTERVRA
jgi:PAS domain S-box-containing protein